MAEPTIQHLVNAFTQSVGLEAAQKLVIEAIEQAGLPVKEIYTKEEFLQICEALKEKGGYVRIIATVVSTSVP